MPRKSATVETEVTPGTMTETAEAPTLTKVKGTPLEGDALLAFVSANQETLAENELLIGAGFYTNIVDENGEVVDTKTHRMEFFHAITAANGIVLKPAKRASGASRAGRQPILSVGKNGMIPVGARYTTAAELPIGCKVQVATEPGKIVITLVEGSVEAEEETEF